MLQVMSYRLIALFDAPGTDPGVVATYYHQASLEEGRLRLSGCNADDESEPARSPLDSLIRHAVDQEWRSRRDSYARQYEHLEMSGDERMVRLANRLRSLPRPLSVRKHGEDLPQDSFELTRESFGLTRDLLNDSEKILARRTIFLVPDYRPTACANEEQMNHLVSGIAQELNGYLETLAPAIGFLKFRRPRGQPVNNGDDPGLMSRIIGNLLKESGLFIGRQRWIYNKNGPLLMDGPTGSGKSMTAELIARDQRKHFVKINISAVTETLLESEMRGHAKGAFTGASKDKKGWFAEADNGVLFLDEFQSVSLSSQTQLLDLLDPTSNDVFVNRVGESNRQRFNVKVILATNRPVHELLTEGKLKPDLFYRIRDIIKLESFNEILDHLESPAQRMAILRRLFRIYRWKSSPYWNEEVVDQSGFACLFPIIDDSVEELIRNFRWEGNYRQFERVVSDIHSRNDEGGTYVINSTVVDEHLKEERRRLGIEIPANCTDAPQEWEQRRLQQIQDLLKRNRFNIGRTVDALKPLRIGLGSRQTLRSYLIKHFNSLRPEIREDSAIAKFLQCER